MRKLNSRFALFLLLGILGTGIAGFAVHWFQSGSIARGLLWQANRAESEGRLNEAAKYLSRYLEFQPKDNAERAHLGEILSSEKLTAPRRTREQALFLLEQVLLKEPERHDSRRTLARLALNLGRAELAQEHLKILHQARPNDGELEELQGRSHEAQGQLVEAANWYRKAVQHAPQQIETHVRLAHLLRRPLEAGKAEQLAREADEWMDRLVAQNAADARAYLARWRYRKAFGGANRADVDAALRHAPEDADALLAAAEVARGEKQFEEARSLLRRGKERHAQDARFYQTLAVVEIAAGQPEQAIAELKKGVQELRGQGQLDLLWTLTNVLFDGKQVREAEALLAQMRQMQASPATLDYLNARLLIHQGQWSEAARMLERTRPQLEGSPDLARQVDQFLGQCYEQLVEPGRVLDVQRRTVAANPKEVAPRLRLIAALQAAGRSADAALEYRELLKLPDAPADAWVDLAHLLLAQKASRSQRDWNEVEEALQRAAKANAAPDKLAVARADLLAAQNQMDAAQALLQKAREQSQSPELWVASTVLAERAGKPEEADRLLTEALARCGDKVELRLARILYAVERRGAEAAAVLEQTEKALPQFKEQEHARLLYGLAEAHYRLGRRADAQRLWSTLAELPVYRNDVRIRLFLFDLALQAGDEAAMNRTLAEIERIDGKQGAFVHYCTAGRLLARGRARPQLDEATRAERAEARGHLEAAAVQRPNWPALLLARGDLEELLRNTKQALTHYRRAYEVGERHPRFLRRFVEMLNRDQAFGEAQQLLQAMQQQQALAPELRRVAVETLMRSGDPSRAMTLLGQMQLDDSTDYRDHLWMAQVQAVQRPRAPEVEQHFRKAVELGSAVPETWLALLQHLVRQGRKAEAELLLPQLKAQLKPEQLMLTLAQCHDALGQYALAREQYQATLTARPDDVAAVRLAAGFYLRWNRPREAEPLLRALADGKLKAADADAAWARHGLGMILAASGDYRQLPKALALVGLKVDADGNLVRPSGPQSNEEAYAQARVLATQPRRSFRILAIALLEDLNQRQGLAADDQFLLAQLYEGEGSAASRAKSRETLRRLTTTHAGQPAYLAAYALTLLRSNQLHEAQQAIDALTKLEESQPGSNIAPELRARLLEARGQGAKAIELLEAHVAVQATKPEKVFVLVEALARQKRLREALDRCAAAWQNCPPEMTAAAALGVLRLGQPTAEDYSRVEGQLAAEIQKQPASLGLRMHLARLYEMREQFEKAEPVYREIIQRDPNHVVALNNLAWLLAQKPTQSGEALTLIRRAIEIMGPAANLLDTRASVYLAQGQFDLAVTDLESATADAPSPPSFFRLALAQERAKRRDAAIAAFQKAQAAGLDPRQLHPIEREAYVQMARNFQQP